MPEPDPWQMVLDALTQLRTDVNTALSGMNNRLDRLVSTETHASDMRRVDQMHKDTQEDLRSLTGAQASLREQMFNMFERAQKATSDESDARRLALTKVESDRVAERWRVIGAVIGILAVAATVFFAIIH